MSGALDRADDEADDTRPWRPVEGVSIGGVMIGGLERKADEYPVPPIAEGKARFRRGHRQTVQRGRWTAHLHGFTCNDCGASTTTIRADQILHDRFHAEMDEFRAKLNEQIHHLAESIQEVANRNLELEQELRVEQAHNNAMLLALRITGPEAEDVVGMVTKRLLIDAGVIPETTQESAD